MDARSDEGGDPPTVSFQYFLFTGSMERLQIHPQCILQQDVLVSDEGFGEMKCQGRGQETGSEYAFDAMSLYICGQI